MPLASGSHNSPLVQYEPMYSAVAFSWHKEWSWTVTQATSPFNILLRCYLLPCAKRFMHMGILSCWLKDKTACIGCEQYFYKLCHSKLRTQLHFQQPGGKGVTNTGFRWATLFLTLHETSLMIYETIRIKKEFAQSKTDQTHSATGHSSTPSPHL